MEGFFRFFRESLPFFVIEYLDNLIFFTIFANKYKLTKKNI